MAQMCSFSAVSSHESLTNHVNNNEREDVKGEEDRKARKDYFYKTGYYKVELVRSYILEFSVWEKEQVTGFNVVNVSGIWAQDFPPD